MHSISRPGGFMDWTIPCSRVLMLWHIVQLLMIIRHLPAATMMSTVFETMFMGVYGYTPGDSTAEPCSVSRKWIDVALYVNDSTSFCKLKLRSKPDWNVRITGVKNHSRQQNEFVSWDFKNNHNHQQRSGWGTDSPFNQKSPCSSYIRTYNNVLPHGDPPVPRVSSGCRPST